jgi:hypothetical protein
MALSRTGKVAKLRPPGREFTMKYLKRILFIILTLLAAVYVGDYALVRIPIPPGRAVFGTVTVRPYYDVGLKSGKSEFFFLDPQRQTCVNSLLPHMGFKPCWYLRKHARERIAM